MALFHPNVEAFTIQVADSGCIICETYVEVGEVMKRFIEACEGIGEWPNITKLRQSTIIMQALLGLVSDDRTENLRTICPVIPDKVLAICKIKLARKKRIHSAGKLPTSILPMNKLNERLEIIR